MKGKIKRWMGGSILLSILTSLIITSPSYGEQGFPKQHTKKTRRSLAKSRFSPSAPTTTQPITAEGNIAGKQVFGYQAPVVLPKLVGILSGNPPYVLLEMEGARWIASYGSRVHGIQILHIEAESVTIAKGGKKHILFP